MIWLGIALLAGSIVALLFVIAVSVSWGKPLEPVTKVNPWYEEER